MIFTPDRRQRIKPVLAFALAGVLLSLGVMLVLSQTNTGSGPQAPLPPAANLIDQARRDIAKDDGIAAEVRLRQALTAGARRDAVAALMGEAFLVQGNPEKARVWLGPGAFSKSTTTIGFRALGRLEQLEGNLAAAGKAFDRAMALSPKDAGMWVEIGRLRYTGGEHTLAIDAADYAIKLDPANIRALEFRGQIVRDQFGLVGALPWFEAALTRAPDDISLLGEYAATLGDLGRAREMLVVTRHMLDLDPKNARAYYFQAVLAARAGKNSLARTLLNHAGKELDDVPGAMLLEGVLEIRAGNYFMAIEALERLVKRQPANAKARDLLARAYFLAGEYRILINRFEPAAQRDGASAYLLTTLGRTYEILDQRDRAAPFLDRAAITGALTVKPSPDGSQIGAQLALGQFDEAQASAESMRAANPGSAIFQALAGDVQLIRRRGDEAIARYRLAAHVRLSESLMLRMAAAYLFAGHRAEARALVDSFLYEHPASAGAARLAAMLAADAGEWRRARLLLADLKRNGATRDVVLLSNLALAQLRDGDAKQAEATAREAYRLQRASPLAAQVLGLCLATSGRETQAAAALLKKARLIMGDTPLLAEGRYRLASSPQR